VFRQRQTWLGYLDLAEDEILPLRVHLDPGPVAELPADDRLRERVLDELKRAFRPEFINRIDDTIVFHALSKEDITSIVRMMVNRINTQLGEKSIQLEPTEAALDLLVEQLSI